MIIYRDNVKWEKTFFFFFDNHTRSHSFDWLMSPKQMRWISLKDKLHISHKAKHMESVREFRLLLSLCSTCVCVCVFRVFSFFFITLHCCEELTTKWSISKLIFEEISNIDYSVSRRNNYLIRIQCKYTWIHIGHYAQCINWHEQVKHNLFSFFSFISQRFQNPNETGYPSSSNKSQNM